MRHQPARPWRAVLPVLLALLLALAGGGAMAQQSTHRQVTVQNETDLVLNFLYLFAPGTEDRGPDRLGNEVVSPSTTFRFRMPRSLGCNFDVVAIWQDGTEEARSGVNICRTPRLVFGDPAMPTLEAAIANRSDVVLRELYASTNGAENWGPDRLGSEVVEAGGGFRLRLRTRDCTFDLRAVYADDREEVKTRLDLCAERGVAFDRSGIARPPSRTLVLLCLRQHR
ncbi:MAG: hypothetical protein B7Z53_01260 [Rhodospirillales bacterium 12-71-4]|nr:MAG: hypothetical protein B7Z53_01260 [Rhodospirillales bacterium 12-71-4]